MIKGLLEVSGTIDLAQFWPTGESDADTIKVLSSGSNAFRFKPHPGAPAKVTHAFEGATVKGMAVAVDANMTGGSFQAYLKPDACFGTADFLRQGVTAATPRHLHDL